MADSLRALLHLLRPERRTVAIALALQSLAAAALLVPVAAASRLAAAFLTAAPVDTRTALAWTAVAAGGAVLHTGAHAASSLLLHIADDRLQLSLRRRVLAVVARRPLPRLDREGSTAVKRAAGDDVDALHHVIGHGVPDAVAAATTVACAAALMAFTSPILAAAAIAPVAAAIWLQRRQRRHLPEHMARYLAAGTELDRAAVELARTATTLKIYGSAADRFLAAARDWAGFVRGWARSVTPSMSAQQVLLSGTAVLFALGGALALGGVDGPDGLADLVGIALVAPFAVAPLWSLAFATQHLAAGVNAAWRLRDLLDDPGEPPAPEPAEPARAQSGAAPAVATTALTLDLAGHRVLSDIAFTCPPGGLTVLVGASGSGKSTLLRCLAGLVRPDTGGITIDGRPLETIPRSELAASTAAVWQTPTLIRGTVGDNLRLGRPGLDDRAGAAALDAVGLAERVRTLPRGTATVLDDDVALSGGERQRLDLARALAAGPRLLLLDEPASWLDGTNAALVDELIDGLRGRCTVVRADHRLDVALAADHLVILDGGRIVQSGHPDSLRDNGAFRSLLEANA